MLEYTILNSDMRLRRVALSSFLLASSLYILLPTPDELFIYPVFGFFLAYVLHIPFVYGVLLSIIIYRSIGAAGLLGALIIGGKTIYYTLKEKWRKKEFYLVKRS